MLPVSATKLRRLTCDMFLHVSYPSGGFGIWPGLHPPVPLSFQMGDLPAVVLIFDAAVVVAGFRHTFPCLTEIDEFLSIPC